MKIADWGRIDLLKVEKLVVRQVYFLLQKKQEQAKLIDLHSRLFLHSYELIVIYD